MSTRDICAERTFQVRASTVCDATRTVRATLATNRRVAVFDQRSGTIVDEILRMDGASIPDQVPLLHQHRRDGLDDVLGSVRGVRREGDRIVGSVHFADDEASERAWQKVRAGHVTDVSAGYQVEECTDIPRGMSRVVAGETFTAGVRTLRITTKWRLKEVSLVVIGADPSSKFRSDSAMSIRTLSEPRDTLRDALLPAMRSPAVTRAQFARMALQHLGEPVPDFEDDLLRAMTENATISDLITAEFGSQVIAGYDQEPDTTRGWTLDVPAKNFLSHSLFQFVTGDRLEPLARGDMAGDMTASLTKVGFHIARFAKKLEVDEQDEINGASMSATFLLAAQLGAMARRHRADAVYALLMQNPTMTYDSVALFDAAHANTGTVAMGTPGIGVAMSAIGNQVMKDNTGDPIHLNLRGKVLLVPPNTLTTALASAKELALGTRDDLEVRQESRIGAAGVVDPSTGDLVVGTTTLWYLAAIAPSRPSIIVAGLNGEPRPVLRTSKLTHGQWGTCYDVHLDIGVAAVGHESIFQSTGTGG